ncbi:MAG: hypothetical protein M3527_07410, partial [Actinomycetota bacterium]|nr:hypothetical protein [Actinomycetota bacterium]
MRVEVSVAAFGGEATAALGRLVGRAKGDDPFASVDVVVPAMAVGVSLRRALARSSDGLLGVRFTS